MNPAIIIAIVIQSLIARASRMAGAIVGFLITTGIFIWGLGLYTDGDAIAFIGIELSQPVFVVACLIWYGFDAAEFIKARNIQEMGEDSKI
ncbi:MAG: hypothetical protein ACE5HS_05715 [bacterium]